MDEVSVARESVHSPVVHAHISHAVIASYVADAALSVPGLHGFAGGGFGPLERRGERAARGVRVSHAGDDEGRVDLELRVVLDADADGPEVCQRIDDVVRDYLRSMVAVETGSVRVVVEGVTDAGDRRG
ncbi:MAG: hypothetical protein AVDCRST_MAG79-635 [uncultured Thermoleophilia bacterium]|uniref:Asp23/Gls24 family envelope stress response protein n=1 Tax=uncultured Thermoleophilia bacterium TaxID=1497501 RepID=A0A6J4TPH2_9ACTN|nr:MAG: hypothetical protein AVDCRST_MAG79-635 [uncultured Thermoleophilia bacterium]